VVCWASDRGGRDRWTDELLALERRLHRRPQGRSARVDARALDAWADPADSPRAEITLDLAGTSPGAWHLEYDGQPGVAAATRSLLAGRFPVVAVHDADGHVVARGRPGSEYPGIVVAALEDVLAGVTTLLVAVASGRRPLLPVPADDPGTDPAADAATDAATKQGSAPSRARRGEALSRHAGRTLVDVGLRAVYRSFYRTPHWRVGWRFVDGAAGVTDLLRLPDGGWRTLPDDGLHFYADPFPIVIEGRTHLFVEDFDHRVGRGVISVVELDERGPLGTPRPVLEHDAHLSYPMVLATDGEIWMIPETSGAGRVELHRAVAFPDKWVLEAVLLDDVVASDVTAFRHGDRWWLMATVHTGGSFSDALHVWHAPSLRGPWTAHAGNPVVLDVVSARPAGHVVHRGGRLLRPAQDGSTGYGGALTLAEIARLDPSTFEQRLVARISPGPLWPGSRLHTLNRAGRLEVIDGSARSPRLPILP